METFDDLFGVSEMPNPTITKDEYIEKAREFISRVNNIYWSNWGYRTLNDDELPDESQCEKCDNHCIIKLDDYEYDCYPDREGGVCRIRVFEDRNYSEEMSELLEKFDHMELINPEVDFVDLKPVELPEITDAEIENESEMRVEKALKPTIGKHQFNGFIRGAKWYRSELKKRMK